MLRARFILREMQAAIAVRRSPFGPHGDHQRLNADFQLADICAAEMRRRRSTCHLFHEDSGKRVSSFARDNAPRPLGFDPWRNTMR